MFSAVISLLYSKKAKNVKASNIIGLGKVLFTLQKTLLSIRSPYEVKTTYLL